jgi:hypothetical protein
VRELAKSLRHHRDYGNWSFQVIMTFGIAVGLALVCAIGLAVWLPFSAALFILLALVLMVAQGGTAAVAKALLAGLLVFVAIRLWKRYGRSL